MNERDEFDEKFHNVVHPFIDNVAPPGYREVNYFSGRLSMRWDRGNEFCSLDLNFRDGDSVVTWSSSQRSISQCTAALALYQQVVGFAAQLELVVKLS